MTPAPELMSASGRHVLAETSDGLAGVYKASRELVAAFADPAQAASFVDQVLGDPCVEVAIPTDLDEALGLLYAAAGENPALVAACDLFKERLEWDCAQGAGQAEAEGPTPMECALADLRAGVGCKVAAERHGVSFGKLRSTWAVERKRVKQGQA